MLFRISFPVPRHGEMLSVTKYIEADQSPTKTDLLILLEKEKQSLKSRAQKKPEDEMNWRELKALDGSLYALRHIKSHDLPKVSDRISDATALCETELEPSAIRISLIRPLSIVKQPLRLASGE